MATVLATLVGRLPALKEKLRVSPLTEALHEGRLPTLPTASILVVLRETAVPVAFAVGVTTLVSVVPRVVGVIEVEPVLTFSDPHFTGGIVTVAFPLTVTFFSLPVNDGVLIVPLGVKLAVALSLKARAFNEPVLPNSCQVEVDPTVAKINSLSS